MGAWWKCLTGRQRAAVFLYGCGAALLVLSLPLTFMNSFEEPMSTLDTWLLVFGEVRQAPGLMVPNDVENLVEETLPVATLLLSFVVIFPGGFLLFLGLHSDAFCWLSRVFWCGFWLSGPCTFLPFLADDIEGGVGLAIWCVAISVLHAAHWVLVPGPARRAGDGMGPGGV